MKTIILRAIACIALATSPLTAIQAQSTADTRLLTNITEAELKSSLAEISAEVTEVKSEGAVLSVQYANGGKAELSRVACGSAECKGLLLAAYFAKPDGLSSQEASELARQFNLKYNPASVVISDNGTHVLKAYLIFDYGITKANLTFRLNLFGSGIARYYTQLTEAQSEE